MDTTQAGIPRGRRRGRSRFRRGVRGALLLVSGLVITGGLYSALLPQPQSAGAEEQLLREGRRLYTSSCISCHGENLQGVPERGPSLIGVGEAAVHFQVSTGRMPMARQQPQAARKPPLPRFDPSTVEGSRNLKALETYVQAHGGGPEMPADRGGELRDGDPARGGQLFRLNCSSCHNFTGRGGALSAGKAAPALNRASPDQLYAAMLTGPLAMPTFGDRQLTPEEKEDIISYVLSVRGQKNTPGGYNLGEYGPTAEGAAAFLAGVVPLLLVALWLGARA